MSRNYKDYEVEITEVLQRTIKLRADSEQDAVDTVRRIHKFMGGLGYRQPVSISTNFKVVSRSES